MPRTWRDLLDRYGPYAMAYNRFNCWPRRDLQTRIFEALAAPTRDSLYLIDSTIVKAHRAASDAKGKEKFGDRRQPGGRSTKIHAAVDGKGRPLNFTLTGGQVHDSQVEEDVLDTPRPALARYDKLARNFLAAVNLVGALQWIKL